MIHLERLSRVYQRRGREAVGALAEVDLQVSRGEFVCVRGPSGSGKSTLLMTIGAMLRPSTGRVEVAGTDLYAIGSRARAAFRAENIGFVFQMFHLLPYLDVRANIATAHSTIAPARRRAATDELLERIGLTERAAHLPAELSAGECQRVAVARAVVGGPQILLADEPTGNLNSDQASVVIQMLAELHEAGSTICLVTHDPRWREVTRRTVHLFDGRVVEPAAGAAEPVS